MRIQGLRLRVLRIQSAASISDLSTGCFLVVEPSKIIFLIENTIP